MTRARIIRNNFSGGLISKEIYGNVDIEQFNNSLEVCDNAIKQASGGLVKRTGTLKLFDLPTNLHSYKIFCVTIDPNVSFVVTIYDKPGTTTMALINATLIDYNYDTPQSFSYITPGNGTITGVDKRYIGIYSDASGKGQNYEDIQIIQNKRRVILENKNTLFPLSFDVDQNGKWYFVGVRDKDKINYTVDPFDVAYNKTLQPLFAYTGRPFTDVNPTQADRYGIFIEKSVMADPKTAREIVMTAFYRFPTSNAYNFSDFNDFIAKVETDVDPSSIPVSGYDVNVLKENLPNAYDQGDVNYPDESTELYNYLLQRQPYMMVTWAAENSSAPSLTYIIKIKEMQLRNTTVTISGSTVNKRYIAFSYDYVKDYCPTTQADTKVGPLFKATTVLQNVTESLPAFMTSDNDQKPIVYFNTPNVASLRFSLIPREQTQENAEYYESYVNPKIAVYEGRRVMANFMENPRLIQLSSRTYQDWYNFYTGTEAGDAIVEQIASDRGIQVINWVFVGQKLFIGTTDGIFVFGSTSFNDDPVTPSNARSKIISSVPSSELVPVRALDSVFFTDASTQKIYEIVYNDQQYAVNEISMLCRDIFKSGIRAHAYMQIPQKLYWASMNDGTLASISYLKTINSLAATRHILGSVIRYKSELEDFNVESHEPVNVKGIFSVNKGEANYVLMDVERTGYSVSGGTNYVISHTVEVFNYNMLYDPAGIRRYYVDCGFEMLNCADFNQIASSYGFSFTVPNDEFTRTILRLFSGRLTYRDNADSNICKRIMSLRNEDDNQNYDDWLSDTNSVSVSKDNEVVLYVQKNGEIYNYTEAHFKSTEFSTATTDEDGRKSVSNTVPLLTYITTIQDAFNARLPMLAVMADRLLLSCFPANLPIFDNIRAHNASKCWLRIVSDLETQDGVQLKNQRLEILYYDCTTDEDGHKLYGLSLNASIIKIKREDQRIYTEVDVPGTFKGIRSILPDIRFEFGYCPVDTSDLKVKAPLDNTITFSEINTDNAVTKITAIQQDVSSEDTYINDHYYKSLLTGCTVFPYLNNKEVLLRYQSNKYHVSLDTGSKFGINPIDKIYKSGERHYYNVVGHIYLPFSKTDFTTKVTANTQFRESYVSFLFDGNEYTRYVNAEGNVINEDSSSFADEMFPNDRSMYWNICGGFPYILRIRTTDANFQSPIVLSTKGLVNHTSEIVLQMLGTSDTGYIGTQFTNMRKIPFENKRTDEQSLLDYLEDKVELVHCAVEPPTDVYESRVCIADNSAKPFHILSITQDLETSDQ